jgi:DNA-binding NtrC family response regulator
VLVEDKMVDAEALLRIAPHLSKTNLPVLSGKSDGMQEREILYKLLFDMKGDLHDLKQLVFELIRGNNLRVPENVQLRPYSNPAAMPGFADGDRWTGSSIPDVYPAGVMPERSAIILDDKKYDKTELVDESLALEDMEKDMIRKSLKRHGGRRKEAALELGISERTLYRKIKQYDI